MKRPWPLLALAALAAGGCGQKGPLYLPDKGGKVVTSAPAATQAQPAPPATAPPATAPPATAPAATAPAATAPAAATPGAAPPESAAPAQPAPPKPADKDKTQDQESQPPK